MVGVQVGQGDCYYDCNWGDYYEYDEGDGDYGYTLHAGWRFHRSCSSMRLLVWTERSSSRYSRRTNQDSSEGGKAERPPPRSRSLCAAAASR